MLRKSSVTGNAWSLFLGIALLQAGVGLQRPLIGLRAETAGFSTLSASLIMTLYYAGFIVGTRFVGHALSRVGHIRTFAGLASTGSSIVLLQGLWIDPISWGLCRF
ncbi:MAG: MFS transporter, partial [Actinomycetota bacterium]|nr:MFS transporter [Actinomycetota bacterium]